MLSPIQITIVGFAIIVVCGVIRRYLKNDIRRGPMILWLLLWFAIAVAVIAPQTTEILARLFSVGRGVDVVIYLAIIVIIFLQYRAWTRLEKVDRAITAVIRTTALQALDQTPRETQPDSNSRE
jgi:hypothetical protein